MHYTIWYHLYNFKNVKNTHGGVLLLVKFQLKPVTLLKVTLLRRYFSRFLNCTNGTKLSKTSHILELFKVLADDWFAISKTYFDIYLEILCTCTAPRMSERIKTEDLRKLGNIRKSQTFTVTRSSVQYSLY